jgi:hypothetical protein
MSCLLLSRSSGALNASPGKKFGTFNDTLSIKLLKENVLEADSLLVVVVVEAVSGTAGTPLLPLAVVTLFAE